MSPNLLQTYSEAIHEKGAALENCFGFVDGTVRPISKPGVNQRAVYNGHKRVHALKFQSLALPNGLIGHLFGPVGKGIFIHFLWWNSTVAVFTWRDIFITYVNLKVRLIFFLIMLI